MNAHFIYTRKGTGHLLSEITSPSPPPHLSSTHLVDTYSWPIEVSLHSLQTSWLHSCYYLLLRTLQWGYTSLLIQQLLTLCWWQKEKGGGGWDVGGGLGWYVQKVCACEWGGWWWGGVERYGCRRKRQKSPWGKSASINNQVTPGALQLLELPQRDVNVSRIALVKLQLPKPFKNWKKKNPPLFLRRSKSAKVCIFSVLLENGDQ